MAASEYAPAPARTLSGRTGALPVSIDTHEFAGQRGRILMRLRADGVPAGALTVRWTARHTLVSGVAQSGDRTVVVQSITLGRSIDDVVTFEIRSTSAVEAAIDILPEFEFEAVGGNGDPNSLSATGADGAQLRVMLPASQMFAGSPQSTLWDVQSPTTEPMPNWIQVTGGGVRLQRDFAKTRLAFSPEVTDQYGFGFKAAVGRAFSSGAAFGVVGGGSRSQRDVVANLGWQISPSQRLLMSAGSMQLATDLAFDSGTERRSLRQISGGGAYSFELGGALQARLDTQAYFAGSGSRELGSRQYFKDMDGEAQIFRQERRVAGALLTGAQTRASLSPFPGSTLTVSVGAERLRYALDTGDQSTKTLTRGVEWAQQIGGSSAVQGVARTQAAMHMGSVGLERRFKSHGQRLGITLTKINGRNGVTDDLHVNLSHSFTFGSNRAPLLPSHAGVSSEMDPTVTALLNEVSQRPAFLPLVLLAKVDRSRRPERLVAVDHAGMVPGTRVDSTDGTVTVPADASIITGITRNLLPFTNTGQFSAANGELQIHPIAMEVPVGGVHQYLVSMQRIDTGVTTVSVDVTHGSVHITRVTIVTEAPDTTPDAFTFAAVPPAKVNVMVASDAVAITGLGTLATISIVNGEYSVDGVPFTAAPSTIADGQQVVVRLRAPAVYGTTATAVLTIGGVSAEFIASSDAAVNTPAPFTFAPRDGVDPDVLVESEDAIVTGMNVPATIMVAGGDYRINGAPYTAASGNVSPGDSVRLRLRSALAPSTMITATLTIGGLAVPFVVTTAAAVPPPDTTPDPFSFGSVTGSARSTAVESTSVTIGGIAAAAGVSIAGGEYSIGNGAFTSAAGTIANGQSVRLRLTTSVNVATSTTATATIGGITGSFTASTIGADTTPDAFSFTAQTGAALSAVATSNTPTVSGINIPAAISIVGGLYSVNAGTYTNVAGTVTDGQTVVVRLTSSAASSTLTTATLTIGGVTGAFNVTTQADTTPDAFSFTSNLNVTPGSVQISNPITVSGISAPAAVSVSGNASSGYSINGSTFTNSPGTVSNGDIIRVGQDAPSGSSATATTTLSIGGVSGGFTTTTAAAPDTKPDAFSFASVFGALYGFGQVSNSITVSGINAPAAISVSGHNSSAYSINGGTFVLYYIVGTVNNGDTVRVVHNPAAGSGSLRTTTLSIGGVTGGFTTTTR